MKVIYSEVEYTVPADCKILASHRGMDLAAVRTASGEEVLYFAGVAYKSDFAVQDVVDMCINGWKARTVGSFIKKNFQRA